MTYSSGHGKDGEMRLAKKWRSNTKNMWIFRTKPPRLKVYETSNTSFIVPCTGVNRIGAEFFEFPHIPYLVSLPVRDFKRHPFLLFLSHPKTTTITTTTIPKHSDKSKSLSIVTLRYFIFSEFPKAIHDPIDSPKKNWLCNARKKLNIMLFFIQFHLQVSAIRVNTGGHGTRVMILRILSHVFGRK